MRVTGRVMGMTIKKPAILNYAHIHRTIIILLRRQVNLTGATVTAENLS